MLNGGVLKHINPNRVKNSVEVEAEIQKKRDWGTKGGYIAPIIVYATPNSELAKSLREIAESE